MSKIKKQQMKFFQNGIPLTVFVLFVFTTCLLGVQERPPTMPKQKPLRDKQTYYAITNNQHQWVLFEMNEFKAYVNEFNEDGVWIFYGIKPAKREKGALAIKVKRFSRKADPDFIDKVMLYRNRKFYSGDSSLLESFTDKIDRSTYNDFHLSGKVNSFLMKDFHAYLENDAQDESKTAFNERRKLFAFSTYSPNSNYKEIRKTYLLKYCTTSRGSWIPFKIGTLKYTDELREIHIVISDISHNSPELDVERIITREK